MRSDVFTDLAPDNHFHAMDGKELFGVRRLVLREGLRKRDRSTYDNRHSDGKVASWN